MQVLSVISTKGGVGKTTVAANLGGFMADAGLSVLLIDLDIQPTLSSYYKLRHTAKSGMYELISANETRLEHLISHTTVDNLHLIFSNDDKGQLNTLLLHAPDGRFRLKNLMPIFEPHYDVVIIDTQGARSILLEMAIVASTHLLSPITPEVLAAREFKRGTLQLIEDIQPLQHLGISIPVINLLINRVPSVSNNAKLIKTMLETLFQHDSSLCLLQTYIPAIEAYTRSPILAEPAHRLEYKKPAGRVASAAIDSMRTLAQELFPQYSLHFERLRGRPDKVVKYDT